MALRLSPSLTSLILEGDSRRGLLWAGVLGVLTTACPRAPDSDSGSFLDVKPPDDELVLEAGFLSPQQWRDLRSSACASWVDDPPPQPLALELVVDVSGSMSLPPEFGSVSKWEITKASLARAVERMPENTHLGAVYFPNQATERNCLADEGPCEPGPALPVSSCIQLDGVLPLAPLGPLESKHRSDWRESLDWVNPAGGTPTHDALNLATEEIMAGELPDSRYLILITDGQPTFGQGCSGSGDVRETVDPSPIIDAIFAARDQGIPTYVIGSPGSESNVKTGEDARAWLSAAAAAGGTARDSCDADEADYCHLDMSESVDFASSLSLALNRIQAEIQSCELSLPAPPKGRELDLDAVNVLLIHDARAEVLGRFQGDGASDPSALTCTHGWQLLGGPLPEGAGGAAQDTEEDSSAEEATSEPVIALCPETCEQLRADPAAQVELYFGCLSAPAQRAK